MPTTFDEWFWQRYVIDADVYDDPVAKEVARAAWDAAVSVSHISANRVIEKLNGIAHSEADGSTSPNQAWTDAVDECIEIVRKECNCPECEVLK